jgi:hypothetical protein
VPVNSKAAVNDDVLPNGAFIRAGVRRTRTHAVPHTHAHFEPKLNCGGDGGGGGGDDDDGEQMQINYSPWVLNRLPQYWDRPNDFRPERWIDGESANGGLPVPKNNALPFIPFNFGPRTCLGMKMVLLTHHRVVRVWCVVCVSCVSCVSCHG